MLNNNNKSLSEQIAYNLYEDIVSKNLYEPGDQLPNEMELAEKYKVSRGTLREAIKVLEIKGILKIVRGRGTYVLEYESIISNADFELLSNQNIDLEDLLEMRLILEPTIAYIAAIRANDSEIEQIEKHAKQIETLISRNMDRTVEEMNFHGSLASATHNEFIKKIIPIINSGVLEAVQSSTDSDKMSSLTIADHRKIVEFIKKRNPLASKAAMQLHISNIMNILGIDIVKL